MDEKKSLDNEDLDKVNGGMTIAFTLSEIVCPNCHETFYGEKADKKTSTKGEGCHKTTTDYFHCPKCGTWVDKYGDTED